MMFMEDMKSLLNHTLIKNTMYKGTIRKIKDTRFEGEHPNNKNEGYSREVIFEHTPTPGYPFYSTDGFHTSTVKEVEFVDLELLHIHTKNSVYELSFKRENLEDQLFREIQERITQLQSLKSDKIEQISDGYHTYKELYEFRKMYNAALFNEWARLWRIGEDDEVNFNVHKSWKHNDGELCFGGGWFVVVAILPTGQISNHYPAEDWDLFKIPEVEKALFPFDGHTGKDVLERLKNL